MGGAWLAYWPLGVCRWLGQVNHGRWDEEVLGQLSAADAALVQGKEGRTGGKKTGHWASQLRCWLLTARFIKQMSHSGPHNSAISADF